jgi:hypothetical protein
LAHDEGDPAMSTYTKSAAVALAALALLSLSGAEPGTAAKAPPTTNLLFPFVTNQAGFDSALVIVNTSADPFDNPATDGACTLHFFGPSAPAPTAPTPIAAGTEATFLASTVAPGFQGYVIATCTFPLGHGWMQLSDAGQLSFAASYSALVLPANRKKNERLGS